MKLKGRGVTKGKAEGKAMVSTEAFSFLGDIAPDTGVCNIRLPGLEGVSAIGKIMVCPSGKGSTRGPITAYRAAKNGVAPAGFVCGEVEPVLVAGMIAAGIPCVDKLDHDPLKIIKTGDWVKVDGDNGIVEVIKSSD